MEESHGAVSIADISSLDERKRLSHRVFEQFRARGEVIHYYEVATFLYDKCEWNTK